MTFKGRFGEVEKVVEELPLEKSSIIFFRFTTVYYRIL
jgi:hypothetical protein